MVLRQITDEVMFEIRNLSGQDYVDTYAGRDVETDTTVVPMPERPAATPEPAVVVASAASGLGHVDRSGVPDGADEADGLERKSSTAVLRSRPLDLDLEAASA